MSKTNREFVQLLPSRKAFHRDKTPCVDLYLTEEEAKKVYALWDEENWGAIQIFSGGVQNISCKMVASVSVKELRSVYKTSLTKKLVEIANVRGD